MKILQYIQEIYAYHAITAFLYAYYIEISKLFMHTTVK